MSDQTNKGGNFPANAESANDNFLSSLSGANLEAFEKRLDNLDQFNEKDVAISLNHATDLGIEVGKSKSFILVGYDVFNNPKQKDLDGKRLPVLMDGKRKTYICASTILRGSLSEDSDFAILGKAYLIKRGADGGSGNNKYHNFSVSLIKD